MALNVSGILDQFSRVGELDTRLLDKVILNLLIQQINATLEVIQSNNTLSKSEKTMLMNHGRKALIALIN